MVPVVPVVVVPVVPVVLVVFVPVLVPVVPVVVPVVLVPVVPVVPVVVPVVPVVVSAVGLAVALAVALVPVVACPHAGNANTKRKVRAANIVRKYSTGFPPARHLSHQSVDNNLAVQTMQLTTPTRSSLTASRSVSSLSLAEKASCVFLAS